MFNNYISFHTTNAEGPNEYMQDPIVGATYIQM